ncbi:hypothetical protein ABTX62_31400 [Streptomyces sp. NPDC096046]|uniref:hypothetical protein n=1 Tax=Streptomyces sp. NPDC096046 TaxID=3155542 RepID=UPI003328ACDF
MRRWFGAGMLGNVAAVLGLAGIDEPWAHVLAARYPGIGSSATTALSLPRRRARPAGLGASSPGRGQASAVPVSSRAGGRGGDGRGGRRRGPVLLDRPVPDPLGDHELFPLGLKLLQLLGQLHSEPLQFARGR